MFIFYNSTVNEYESETNSFRKDFMIQLMMSERTKAEDFLKSDPSSKKSLQMSRDIFGDPLIFIRKWIGEGFVTILDSPAIMWCWDQFMMQGWDKKAIEDLCLALLMLLKYKFLDAKNYLDMKATFFGEPCKLYTNDIIRAWKHLQNEGNLLDIPEMIKFNSS